MALAVNRQSDSQADRRRTTGKLMETGKGKTLGIVPQTKAATCAIAFAFVSPKLQAPAPHTSFMSKSVDKH